MFRNQQRSPDETQCYPGMRCGGSTEHIFEAKVFDGKTIAGRVRTRSPPMSFDDVPYSYDITFSAAIEPGR